MVESLQDAIMRKLATAAVLATALPLLAEDAEIEGLRASAVMGRKRPSQHAR